MSRITRTLVGLVAVVAAVTVTSVAPGHATAAGSAVAGSSADSEVLFEYGDESRGVRIIQARLRQIGFFDKDVTGYYGAPTRTAVRGFQAKRGIPVTGKVDRRTLRALESVTDRPTAAEMHNQPPPSAVPRGVDRRCLTGRVLCADKTTSSLRWIVDGDVRETLAARFGGPSTPTREGAFRVYRKSRDHVSSIYHTPMPYAMFFSGGQAVHYSPDFAANGYNGSSHGCVNIRAKKAIARIFAAVRIGDTVVVYRS